jgi:nitrite reductase/ring-hydroxylating ferredoxin subunit
VPVFVARRSDLDDGTRVFVEVDGTEVGVFVHDTEVFAYENRCLHQGGPVCEGSIIGAVEQDFDDDGRTLGYHFSSTELHLVCPWHGYEYSLTTGECPWNPQLRLRRYGTVERDGCVYVETDVRDEPAP